MNDLMLIFGSIGALLVVASVVYTAGRAEATARELARIRELLEQQAPGRSE